MNTKKHKKNGFTLIELLVVIAIVGVLSGVVLQSLNSARANARDAQRLSNIDQINKALELSATGGTNTLPSTSLDGTGYNICLGLNPDTTPNSCGGLAAANWYLPNATIQSNLANKVIPRDPLFKDGIGTAYIYNSMLTPATTPASTAGAYLSWVLEDRSSTAKCGRGVRGSNIFPNINPITNGTRCFLRIGNAI